MSGGRKPESSRPSRRRRASSSGLSSRPKSDDWPTKHLEQNQLPQSSTPSWESSSALQALQVRMPCFKPREYAHSESPRPTPDLLNSPFCRASNGHGVQDLLAVPHVVGGHEGRPSRALLHEVQ